MRAVSTIVSLLVREDEVASEALRRGILNLSAYAQDIHPKVEELAWKQVQKGTIVVSLARIAVDTLPLMRPRVTIDDLKIKAPLCDISYEKTEKTVYSMQTLREHLTLGPRSVFTLTEGMSEITIIASASLVTEIQKHFDTPYKALYPNVIGISVGFSKEYLQIPNSIYTLFGSIATKHINIIEVISTFTELMFVVDEKDREACVASLAQFFPN